MWIIQIAIITFSIVALMAFISRPMYYMMQTCKALGFGFLVYHSDSQKYFYCLTRKDALEWMAATYADAVMFSNSSKDTIAIVKR
jgi:penicillin-binding protein-related factor A (putative recombinase)